MKIKQIEQWNSILQYNEIKEKAEKLPASITASQSVVPFFLNCIKSQVPATHLGSTKPLETLTSSATVTAEADPFVPTEIFSGGGFTAVSAESEVPAEALKGERENKGRFLGLRVRVKRLLWWGLESEEWVVEILVRGEKEAIDIDIVVDMVLKLHWWC